MVDFGLVELWSNVAIGAVIEANLLAKGLDCLTQAFTKDQEL
jgi:hypothetical protein